MAVCELLCWGQEMVMAYWCLTLFSYWMNMKHRCWCGFHGICRLGGAWNGGLRTIVLGTGDGHGLLVSDPIFILVSDPIFMLSDPIFMLLLFAHSDILDNI